MCRARGPLLYRRGMLIYRNLDSKNPAATTNTDTPRAAATSPSWCRHGPTTPLIYVYDQSALRTYPNARIDAVIMASHPLTIEQTLAPQAAHVDQLY
jgi:hypothetical protein